MIQSRRIKKLREQIRSYYKNMNVVLFTTTLILMAIGLVAIYSASSTKIFFYRQFVWFSMGFVLMMVFANINYNVLINIGNHLYFLFMFLLILVLVAGYTYFGAQRWIKIAGFTIQPSEFMKIVIALAIIRYILVRTKEAFTWKNLFKLFVYIIVPMLMILKQPDLGTVILMIPMILVVLFLGNIPKRKIIIILLIGIMMLPVGYLFLHDYQRQRIQTFINPNLDPLGSGYNVIQSKIAIGSGQLTGKGWIQGTQSQLNFIPIKYTDFIFALIGEEFGFLGCLFVIIIYMFLVMEGLKIVKLCRYTGGKMLGGALVVVIFTQFAVNIGMNIGILPVTGITLPLLSYGGTSVLVTMMTLGILQNIYREYMKAEG